MTTVQDKIDAVKADLTKPYFIRYKTEVGRFSPEDAGEAGLTQDLIIISGITQPNGSFSNLWAGIDGITGEELSIDHVFKMWALMGSSFIGRPGLPLELSQVAENMMNRYREAMFK